MQADPRPRIYQAIVDQIEDDIFRGRRPPGHRLPPELMLAAQFGVSRGAVREALRVLELRGLVLVRYGHAGGVFVAAPDAVPLLQVLRTSLELGQLSIAEVYQARVLFEPRLARLAVEEDHAGLTTQLAANLAAAKDLLAAGAGLLGTNLEFHLILARASGNRALGLVMGAFLELLERLERGSTAGSGPPSVQRTAVRDHQQILRAVRAGDGEQVEALALAHLRRLERRFASIEDRHRRARATQVEVIPSWGAELADDASAQAADEAAASTVLTIPRDPRVLSGPAAQQAVGRAGGVTRGARRPAEGHGSTHVSHEPGRRPSRAPRRPTRKGER